MASFRNDRTGEVVETSLNKDMIALTFAATAPDNNWLWFWLVKHIQRSNEGTQANRDMIAFIADSFVLAQGMGLKKPMIRLHFNGRRYKVYLSNRGTLCFKSGALVPVSGFTSFEQGNMTYHDPKVHHPAGCQGCTTDTDKHGKGVFTNDPMGDEEYVGCLFNGKFLPNKQRALLPAEVDFFAKLSADPAGFMSQCSKDMCRCCYCYKPLEDARSKQVGYGATCAVRWGLPWGKGYNEKVPSFASLWGNANATDQRSIRGICAGIRANPRDEFGWQMLGDALADVGYTTRPKMPPHSVTLPAA